MQLYEMFHPALDTYVRYKVLVPQEVEMIHEEQQRMTKDAYMRMILEAVIFNLTEVTDSLREMKKSEAKDLIMSLYNGALMLNPALDIDTWIELSQTREWQEKALAENPAPKRTRKRASSTAAKKITRAKFANLERYLKEHVIGQDHAANEIVSALKRSIAGLSDENRPLGVFLFAGASGVGKTHLARELHKYLFDGEMVRVDCGEYMHKHESSKLIGAPPGYVGYDEGGTLTNALKKNPYTVVLLDEVEKAHQDIWHTFLRVFDEGIITTAKGEELDFKNTIIIMTTNLGNRKVVDELTSRGIGFQRLDGEHLLPSRQRIERYANESIRKSFTPEFLNRIDKVVVFNHLTKEDLQHIAELELGVIDNKLSKRGFSLKFDSSATDEMVNRCTSDIQGARGMSQIRRDDLENSLADKLINGRFQRGTIFNLTWNDGFIWSTHRPTRSGTKNAEVDNAE